MTVPRNKVLLGDCLATMPTLPAGCAHVAITSPPYFALRSYLPKDHPDKAREIGSEPTPEAFIATMVAVFREVRRVLRDDGVLVVNLGDSYSAGGWECRRRNKVGTGSMDPADRKPSQDMGVPDGNQLLIPHRVALALQADGWCLRSTVVWRKPSPMPESISGWRWRKCRVKVEAQRYDDSGKNGDSIDRRKVGFNDRWDHPETHGGKYSPCPGCPKCLPNNGYVLRRGKWRPTTAHEYIFLFTKGGDYFCDGDAVQEAVADISRSGSGNTHKRWGNNHTTIRRDGTGEVERQSGIPWENCESRNPRSVQSFANEPFKGKHFACFPSSLPAFFIKAATSKAGCCPACGACYAPVVESERVPTRPGETNVNDPTGMANRDPQRHVARTTVRGYRPTCTCNAGEPVPCLVFDPFLGSGQTARAAHWLGRDWLGCELNPEYAAMVPERIAAPPKWAIAKPKAKRLPVVVGQKSLFAEAGA